MVGWFPTSFPDETLHSICGRYSRIVKYTNIAAVARELFGEHKKTVSHEFPCSLNHLVSVLPDHKNLTVERIIDEHTIYSFFFYFLPKKRAERIKACITESNNDSPNSLLGVNTSKISLQPMLKFCPECFDQDREKFGIAYWHRLHQIPGVHLCIDHLVFLENSEFPRINASQPSLFVNLEDQKANYSIRQVDLKNQVHNHLLDVATDAAWLLQQKHFCPGYDHLYKLYNELLYNKRLLDFNGRVKHKELNELLLNSYPLEFLEIIQCNIEEKAAINWTANIIRDLKSDKVHHPIRHIVLIRLLGETVESFFNRVPTNKVYKGYKVEDNYFNGGPYPCLNIVCPKYKKSFIKNFHIQRSGDYSAFTLCVTCDCGFSYSRKGPDTSPDDIYTKDYINDFGEVWRNELRNLWQDTSISFTKVFEKLNSNKQTVKKQAIIMGLKFPRKGPRNSYIQITTRLKKALKSKNKNRKIKESFEEILSKNRRVWLKAVKNNPSIKRTILKQKIVPKAANWLIKHDKNWFKMNQPPRTTVYTGGHKYIDWKERDVKLVAEIYSAADKIRSILGEPKQINIASISREIENYTWVKFKKILVEKLPLSNSALNKVIESQLDFELRRIKYAAEQIKICNSAATFQEITKIARINRYRWNVPEIIEAIKKGIDEIENTIQI